MIKANSINGVEFRLLQVGSKFVITEINKGRKIIKYEYDNIEQAENDYENLIEIEKMFMMEGIIK